MEQHYPFCHLESSRIAVENDCAVAIPDAFPVAEGHMLVVPKRHVASLYDLPDDEQAAIWRLVAQVRGKLASELRPDAFNVGVNDGPAWDDVNVGVRHGLPCCRAGDVADPRGGVRWVLPGTARYWAEEQK